MSIFDKTVAWFKGLTVTEKQLLAVAFGILLNYQLAIFISLAMLVVFVYDLWKAVLK
jgi:hypothetical protein